MDGPVPPRRTLEHPLATRQPTLPSGLCPRCGHTPFDLDAERPTCGACGFVAARTPLGLDLAPHVPRPPAPPSDLGRQGRREARWQRLVQAWSGVDHAHEAAWMRRHVQPASDGPLLELACGGGREARRLAALFGGHRVLAVDLDLVHLTRAARASRGTGIRFARVDALRLPFADASVAAVNCFGALHHLVDPATALAEVGRVLAPGGSFTAQALVRPARGPWRLALRPVQRPLRLLAEPALDRAFAAAGLRRTALEHHRGIALVAATRTADR